MEPGVPMAELMSGTAMVLCTGSLVLFLVILALIHEMKANSIRRRRDQAIMKAFNSAKEKTNPDRRPDDPYR
mgnify:CR=1 FL=1|tara:strand:+ start:1149 stop:1364 length:216 start_codon:yes stop_codon:yes gene_type:complete